MTAKDFLRGTLNRLNTIDAERFAHVSSGVQNTVLSVAIILGGIWTFATFKSLQQTAKARAEINIMEKQLKEQAAFDLDLDATQEYLPEDPSRYVSIIVRMKNTGNRNARIDFPNTDLSISRIHFDEGGQLIKETTLKLPVPLEGSNTGVVVRANTAETIPFFGPLPGPGLYLLTFRSSVSPQEKQVTTETGVSDSAIISWTRSRFIIVK